LSSPAIRLDDRVTTFVLAADGSAHWDGCEDGRVGKLSLER
jgi:hypothetical protein